MWPEITVDVGKRERRIIRTVHALQTDGGVEAADQKLHAVADGNVRRDIALFEIEIGPGLSRPTAAGKIAAEIEIGAEADVFSESFLNIDLDLIEIKIESIPIRRGETAEISQLSAAAAGVISGVTTETSDAVGAASGGIHRRAVIVLPAGHDIDVAAEFNAPGLGRGRFGGNGM